MELKSDEIKKIIPHRYPFLLIDKVTDMKPGEILHLRNGYTVELESVKPITCGVMLTFKASAPDRKENHNER